MAPSPSADYESYPCNILTLDRDLSIANDSLVPRRLVRIVLVFIDYKVKLLGESHTQLNEGFEGPNLAHGASRTSPSPGLTLSSIQTTVFFALCFFRSPSFVPLSP